MADYSLVNTLIVVVIVFVMVLLPAYVSMRLARAKGFYPVWAWVVAAIFLSWIVVLVQVLVPRRAEVH